MPFYLRKSVSAGPFRFNFSKGGVGASVGIKGLRIGTGPRGHYINVGYSGIYYRATLGKAGQAAKQPAMPASPARLPATPSRYVDNVDNVEMIEIESGDVQAMRDEGFAELLDELNQKQNQAKLSVWLTVLAAGVGAIAFMASGTAGLVAFALMIPAYFIGRWLDSYRRSAVMFYEMDDKASSAYETMTQSFDVLNQCQRKWHMAAGGDVRDLTTWKRNAGASQLVDKKPTTLGYGLPVVIKSNVTPPLMHVGRQILYFFPDLALVEDGGRFGAVSYSNLHVRWQDSRFIEDGGVPGDARVVGQTWKHPNKSGGPDRRFKDNRQIPICMYETMSLSSSSGVNEAVQFSRTDVSAAFSQSLRALPGQAISISSRAASR